MHTFSVLLALSAFVGSSVSAAAAHEHHVHKRAVVTDYVHVTQVLYENAHVWVDLSGVPYSTSYELVSTAIGQDSTVAPSTVTSAIETAAANNLAAQTPSAEAAETTSTSSAVETSQAPVTSTSQYVAPTTSTSQYVAPVVTSSSAVPTTPSTTYVAPTTEETTSYSEPSSTSSAAAATSSSSSSGGDFSGDATYYTPGLGACGWESSSTDLIAALNADQFHSFGSMSNGNPACGKSATITRNGKTVTVKIVDLCPECAYGSLDLSPSAFDEIADEAEGRVEITWSWS